MEFSHSHIWDVLFSAPLFFCFFFHVFCSIFTNVHLGHFKLFAAHFFLDKELGFSELQSS